MCFSLAAFHALVIALARIAHVGEGRRHPLPSLAQSTSSARIPLSVASSILLALSSANNRPLSHSIAKLGLSVGVPPLGQSNCMKRTQSLQMEVEIGKAITTSVQDQLALQIGTVVKVHGTGVRPSYLRPWQALGQTTWTGSGFVIAGQRIMTNAHCVEDETVLQVQRQGNPKKFRAKVLCISHDLDLAILGVEEAGFWDSLPHAAFASSLPDLYSTVQVVGFPTGGSTICVSKGIVSRVDVHVYAHPASIGIEEGEKFASEVLIIQIDAAINPGNSGGPVFDRSGRVVGVASSGRNDLQNCGYIIPASIVQLFLDEFDSTGAWGGISEPGFSWKPLESSRMRSFLRMGSTTGVLVDDVSPLGAVHGRLQTGDIITHIDEIKVSNEGNILVSAAGQKVFLGLNAQIIRKPKGELTALRILRDGEPLTIEVPFGPVPSLAPRFHAYDSWPDYVLIGGLVFMRASIPLYSEYKDMSKDERPPMNIHWMHRIRSFKEDADQELVILTSILEHDANIGYSPKSASVLGSFNERKVHNLADLARFYGEAMRSDEDGYLRFNFEHAAESKTVVDGVPDIILSRSKIKAANAEVCKGFQISSVVSAAMQPHFQGDA